MSKQKQTKVVMDIDAILDFIFSPDEKRNSDIGLEETLIPDGSDNIKQSQMVLARRVKNETKSGEHSQHEAIRLDLMQRLLDLVNELEVEDGQIVSNLTFGEAIAFNTLFNYGFLKEL